jgi:hypothetical protein
VMCACIIAFSSASGMRHSSTLSCTMALCLQRDAGGTAEAAANSEALMPDMYLQYTGCRHT